MRGQINVPSKRSAWVRQRLAPLAQTRPGDQVLAKRQKAARAASLAKSYRFVLRLSATGKLARPGLDEPTGRSFDLDLARDRGVKRGMRPLAAVAWPVTLRRPFLH